MDTEKLVISTKKYRNESSVISSRLPVELVREIDEIGKQTGRTRSEIIQICLEFAMDRINIE